MNSPLLFSVIVPTHQRNDLLAKCLDCLAPGVQTLPAQQYEVIVTDDGSQITAEEMIRERYPWAKWVAGSRKGPAANRNNGARFAQGEWLAFTDDDCLPEPEWLSALAEATTGSALALEGAIHPVGDPNQDMAECPVNLTGGYFWSANVAVQKKLFETVSGFDPNYFLAANEDTDLKLRLTLHTIIAFIPEARIFHPVRLISFKKKLFQMPIRWKAWEYHVKKNKQFLGYNNIFQYAILQYKSHSLSFFKRIKKKHYKATLISLTNIVLGIPLNIIRIYLIPSLTPKKIEK
jgi:GT2 family glycosyltransferase